MKAAEDFVRAERDRLLANAGKNGIKTADWDAQVDDALQLAIKKKQVERPPTLSFVRQQRREEETRQHHAGAEFLRQVADAMVGATILGADDPILLRPVAVGSGERKSFKFCTIEDLDDMISKRRVNMANVVAAFDRDSAAVDLIKKAMRAASAPMVQDALT